MDIRNKSIAKGHSFALFLIDKQNQLNMNQLKSNNIHVLSETCIIPRGAGTLRDRKKKSYKNI